MKNDSSAKENVFNSIVQNNRVSASIIAKEMNVAQRTVERYIHELKAEGRLKRFGSARNGYWYPVLKK